MPDQLQICLHSTLKVIKNCKLLKLIYIEIKAKSSFPESYITGKEKKFWHKCLEAYEALVSHLKLKLPQESTVLRNAIFLNIANKGDNESLNAVTNLIKEVYVNH